MPEKAHLPRDVKSNPHFPRRSAAALPTRDLHPIMASRRPQRPGCDLGPASSIPVSGRIRKALDGGFEGAAGFSLAAIEQNRTLSRA